MKTAVLELVDGAQVEIAERHQLAHARLVEQAVADDRSGDPPQEPAQHDADEPRPRRPSWARVDRASGAHEARDYRRDEDHRQHDPGEPDARVNGEDDGP